MRLLFALALIGFACALPQRKNRVVGGTPVPIERYPFMVNMQVTWREGIFASVCGGSLITRTAVLSAAHCYIIELPDINQWRARLGSESDQVGGVQHAVARFIIHPNYVHITLTSDVAIVRLAIPAMLSNRIQVARIAGPNYPLPDNLRVYVVGWGDRHHEEHEGSEFLLHTDVRVINHEICTERYAELKTQPGYEFHPDVTPAMLCTGHLDVGGQDACQGDSGGPVVHGGDIVVGITSWGYECAHPRYPGVSARVPSYTEWIVENAVA
ncbi:trypsin CFT-1-like [Maniola jurtina]|uniref:trypsin CFT-1-like n=1 Tax=Maniola jurtina TaxID=191418 RepID=UPI001E68783A|nr:trypsin CFT-1-like [Maniola jurtina]